MQNVTNQQTEFFKRAAHAKKLLAISIAIATSSSLTSAQPDSSKGTFEEIVVTAQRRSELAVDVPISITAIDAEQLNNSNVQQLGDIARLTPGIRFDKIGANAQPTIRGVGTAVVVAGAGSNVALYTDGFYSPNPLMADSDLLNIKSVQVLKGPQGTLFGRNSTGGAVLVTTSEPSSQEHADIEVSYGSYNAQRYQVYATGGASDELAFDVAGIYRKGDGYLDNIINGSDKDGAYENSAIRLGARWEVNDKLSFLLRYAHSNTDDPSSVAVNAYERHGIVSSSAAAIAAAYSIPNVKVASKPYDVSNGFEPSYTARADELQLTTKIDLDFAMLTSFTQYRDETGQHRYDFDASSMDIYHYTFETTDKIFTQEFLLASSGENRLQWTTGLFYFADETQYPKNRESISGAPFLPKRGSGVDVSSYAIFGDATYALLDNLYLTAGLRYSKDKSTNAYFIDDNRVKVNVDDLDDEQLTPRLALRYEFTPNSNVYASYSQGFKSSILNVAGNTTVGIQVDPEKINAYEIGYKYSSGALQFDAAAFYYDYKDLQVASYVADSSFIKNAANSTIYGGEVQTRYAFTDRFQANVGVSFMHAEYDKFDESQTWDQCLAATCGIYYGVYLPGYGDAAGNEMQRSPEFTGTLGLNYQMDVAGGSLDLSGTLYHTSHFYFDSSNLYKQDAYDLLSMRAAWTDPSKQYTVAVYGDNLTDEEYRTQVLPQFYGALSTWGAPRTFGVSLGMHF